MLNIPPSLAPAKRKLLSRLRDRLKDPACRAAVLAHYGVDRVPAPGHPAYDKALAAVDAIRSRFESGERAKGIEPDPAAVGLLQSLALAMADALDRGDESEAGRILGLADWLASRRLPEACAERRADRTKWGWKSHESDQGNT